MKNKHRSRCSFARKRIKWLYPANSKASPSETEFPNLGENDLNFYLSILQTQGVTWNTLSWKAHQYITIGKLPIEKELDTYGIRSGYEVSQFSGPSLKSPCYFYAHTIDKFNGVPIPETVIYVGISGDEDITKVGFKGQFGRAFQKSKKSRSWLWRTIMKKAKGSKVHILPLRLEANDCKIMETYFIDTIGRFCCLEPYQGPLVNLQRDRRDSKERSEASSLFYEENPHFKGEGGLISIIQQNIWSDSSIREAQSDRLNNHIATLTKEQKQARKDNTTKHFEPFKEWKGKFMKQFCYDTTLLEDLQIAETGTLFDNYKDIEVTEEYTKKLESIQESGFFYRQKRRDNAKRNLESYGVTLVFPEYQEKKIKTYLEENDLSLDEVKTCPLWGTNEVCLSSVLGQWNAYWIPDNQALLNHFLAIEKSIEPNDQASGEEKCSFGTPCGALSSITTENLPPLGYKRSLFEDSQIDNTKKLSNAVARMEVAMSKVEELENWESWVEKTLEPYKHETDYGTRYQPSNFLNDFTSLQKLEEIKKRPDIFIRYGRADNAKRSGWDWDLIYLETGKKRGPCWAPSKELLKKLYDDEKNRINTLKLEALQSEGLVKTFASAAATEGGAFEKKLRVCDRTVVPQYTLLYNVYQGKGETAITKTNWAPKYLRVHAKIENFERPQARRIFHWCPPLGTERPQARSAGCDRDEWGTETFYGSSVALPQRHGTYKVSLII